LRALADDGVAVVAAAGNGASTVEFHPAALAAVPSWTGVPLVSVGASLPGGALVASYSNTGPWVRAYRCGSNVVSTMPVTFNGSLQASQASTPNGLPPRATPDGDDYGTGFGLWTGTSFAAPVLAGEIAAALAGGKSTDKALEAVLGGEQ
ncbi:MAG: S8 family serine peptidase, partial [Nocardioides sp.]|uniref:S8 family serine peptidase n=1 Tax=Nocardioides sp. TaxID=35761 RepID=UPI003F071DF3